MWAYREHQVEGAAWALHTIRQHGLAYLGWEERTGKTGTALLTVEDSLAKTCLIVTKKKAIPGWEDALNNFPTKKKYMIINYESVHKITHTFDFIILDEAHHAISSCPKPSLAFKRVSKLTKDKPILYLSATPYAEHLGLIFHQLKLSSWTPLNYDSFYKFHRDLGIPEMEYTPTPRETYKQYKKDEILKRIGHLFNWKKRSEVGIEHEPSVNLITVPLSDQQNVAIRTWLKDQLIELNDEWIPSDSPGKARSVHYQMEGGTVKLEDSVYQFDFIGKVDYIKKTYIGQDIAIMAHFVAEREMLSKEFPNTRILSSDGDAEGVDLSNIAKLLIYSMSDKTSKYTQRLARQANHERKTPIVVDILVADKPGIGMGIYQSVALKKENFVKDSYERFIRTIR